MKTGRFSESRLECSDRLMVEISDQEFMFVWRRMIATFRCAGRIVRVQPENVSRAVVHCKVLLVF